MEVSFGKVIVSQPGQPEQEYDLHKDSLQIGRGMTNDIILNDGRVSRSHLRLDFSAAGCKLTDLGSSNGTLLNGKLVKEADLQAGDEIKLGETVVKFLAHAPEQDSGMTVIDTLVDLESTMLGSSLPVSLNETNQPRLVICTPEKTWEVSLADLDELTIGRTDENDVMVDLPKISRRHARIVRSGNAFLFKDLGSTNGSWLGSQQINEHLLADGQALRIGQARLVFKQGFVEESLTMADISKAKLDKRLPVVFVPGLMGSQLYRGSECVWPNLKLMISDPGVFTYPGKYKLEPRGILDQVVIVPNLVKMDQYNRLGNYLVEELGYQRSVNFFEYAYDWRQDVRISARQLSEAVQKWNIHGPFILIAHSLGTLVSRYYIDCLGGKKQVQRMILMGGPHIGTPAGLTSLTIGPNILPFGLMGEQLRKVVASFPSAYQIIPEYACGENQAGEKINFLTNETWVQENQLSMLRAAQEFRSELNKQPSVPCVSIFGYGLKTVAQIKIHINATGKMENVVYMSETNGDDSVPQQSAFLSGSEIHPVRQHHGALFVDNDVKMRLKLELLGPGML